MVVYAEKIAQNGLSVRDTENLVRRANERAAQASEESSEEVVTSASVMRKAQIRMLEKKSMSLLGRKVKISTSGKKHTVELYYNDDEDLTALLTAICGEGIFDENN